MIELKNIEKTYVLDNGQQVPALKGVNLKIEKGEIFGVIGLSGAGKSTLVRIINMLERPTAGSVFVNGQEMTALNEKQLLLARRDISMIFQSFNLLSSCTVAKNVAFPLTLDKTNTKEKIDGRVKELLSLVGLSDKADVYPSQLSGGQKQRVAIARALASNPKVLLCDEATSALDPKTTSSILKLLRSLRKKLGLTIVIITHQMEVIKECCDRVAVIDGGVISEINSALEIFANPKNDLTRKLVDAAVRKDLNDLLAYTKLSSEYHEGDRGLVELIFRGERANDPVIVEVSTLLKVKISIIAGTINHISKEPLGFLICEIDGDKELIERTLEELRGRVYKMTFLGFESQNSQIDDSADLLED
ncbi:MAG TPA: methionine ABC transporter ATP-binding protein [Succinivibrionaceae bacterium]|nr:methionine ABC transporter ATP-binding protein [Succinivibrionaceae bacterium]